MIAVTININRERCVSKMINRSIKNNFFLIRTRSIDIGNLCAVQLTSVVALEICFLKIKYPREPKDLGDSVLNKNLNLS